MVCFFRGVMDLLAASDESPVIHSLRSGFGPHEVHEVSFDGKRIAVFHPGTGAPITGGLLDEAIALGCRKVVACGCCGVLNGDIASGHLVVPISAVRDEGTSYHYLPPGREVEPTPAALAAVEETLKKREVHYVRGKTWTTDAFYRETRGKVNLRRAEGCLTVEMEAAAMFAVARFRGVELAQILCGADDLSGDEWDPRDLHRHSTAARGSSGLPWRRARRCRASCSFAVCGRILMTGHPVINGMSEVADERADIQRGRSSRGRVHRTGSW